MGFMLKHKIILIGCLVAVVALLSITSPSEDRGPIHRGVLAVTAPIQNVLVSVVDGIGSIWHGYFDLVDAREELDDLQEKNRFMAREIGELNRLEQENARLRRLLGFTRELPMRYLPARVIATDVLGQFRTVTVNAGLDEGVRKGYPVVDADGVVGRVIEVYGGSARVLLMIDPNSSIDGRVLRTGAQGIIQGRNDPEQLMCQFAFSLRTEDVQVDDTIVTSGLDQQFPPGLVLGKVTEVSRADVGIFQEAVIQPSADFTRLREVLVLLPGKERP